MKKLLLAILLIAGCTREYECDVGIIQDDGEFYSLGGPNTQLEASATVDWPDGKKEAEEGCESSYNDNQDSVAYFHCICQKAD